MDVIEWLRSAEGEAWSKEYHHGQNEGGNPGRHSWGVFASMKNDHECAWDRIKNEYHCCGPYTGGQFSYTNQILAELEKYGMNGLPCTRQAS